MSVLELRADRVGDDGNDAAGSGERLAAGAAWVLVRLWCLPVVLPLWAVGWAALGACRVLGASDRSRPSWTASRPHRPIGRPHGVRRDAGASGLR